ncbi:Jumonji domain-containing protein [Volvox carteri f. nagariensis]|uniref:Jumonji domain-containing protein n=1 Tax=Volvox carteri f. nagariensis TaxID=3068 RepID=D8U859_VOLCA|nr:Jumonji domain-containing protein [Volvox carteri f. nagariensis]EFJ44031.1 Jumonji domain-containing protein [Volvox carteri f. nagariensis]|eukprot:XP_002954832.1 Jumonji domain-containing protein [Volvox carteri f. nagariensis]
MRECPVLYPTLEDIQKPFEAFIEKHEYSIAQAGIAKIVAPEGWSPRRQGYPDDLDFNIERPIRQHATGSRGLYRGLYIEEKPMSLSRDFRPQALAPENLPPPASGPGDLERKYWKNVTLRPPLYGADVLGSLFDPDCEARGWNLRRLDTVLTRVLDAAGQSVPGVSEPYLYFGTWRSTFAWHTEDVDLYSVNYLHFGAPKQWYCIPPCSRKRFEGLVKGMLPDMFKACQEFFRHKELIISPQLLDTHAIPYIKTVQHPREFIINFPGAYHAGYNCGYNCAESVNFGTRWWVPVGAKSAVCKCNPDSVFIDMRLFR